MCPRHFQAACSKETCSRFIPCKKGLEETSPREVLEKLIQKCVTCWNLMKTSRWNPRQPKKQRKRPSLPNKKRNQLKKQNLEDWFGDAWWCLVESRLYGIYFSFFCTFFVYMFCYLWFLWLFLRAFGFSFSPSLKRPGALLARLWTPAIHCTALLSCIDIYVYESIDQLIAPFHMKSPEKYDQTKPPRRGDLVVPLNLQGTAQLP